MGAVTERLELMVPKTDAENRASTKAKWESQGKQQKLDDLAKRTDGIVGNPNADDATLNSLNDHLTSLGH